MNLLLFKRDWFADSERYLLRLARRSFLSLWSYSNIFRNQTDGSVNNSNGKEICNLLVIFGRKIIIFSDKNCQFPEGIDISIAWKRWFKKSILASARQIHGAERWITNYPERIFLDPECKIRFPIVLPNLNEIEFHRVIVVHSISEHSKRYFGSGNGSLLYSTDLLDNSQTEGNSMPFCVGDIDKEKGYVHILDDFALDAIMSNLDTISDFVRYLEKKEKFMRSGVSVSAAGEEELLAYYLSHINSDGEHDFIIDSKYNGIYFDQGIWKSYSVNPQRMRKIQADDISYLWDDLIEEFSKHAIQNTQYYATTPGIQGSEPALRIMASLDRFKRRNYARALSEFIHKYRGHEKITRTVLPPNNEGVAFIFLMLGNPFQKSYESYRRVRRILLEIYCEGLKVRYPTLKDIVGIAFDSNWENGGSEDLAYLNAREWDSSRKETIIRDMELANVYQSDLEANLHSYSDDEYPKPVSKEARNKFLVKGRDINKPCPCGSGKKYKKCCMYTT